MRRKILAGNWKMFKTPEETRAFLADWFESFKSGVATTPSSPMKNKQPVEVVIFPPAYNLSAALESVETVERGSMRETSGTAHGGSSSHHLTSGLHHVAVGAQNCHFASEGAFTGELSPVVLHSMGAKYVLLGHSERRELFHETDELIAKKVRAALDAGLTPVLCVGEKLPSREAGQTWSVVEKQLELGLSFTRPTEEVVIAYEPVWAIGTGKVATPEQANEVHEMIRKRWSNRELTILYGGSVKLDNIGALASMPDIDGFLVGGASLKSNDFYAMGLQLLNAR